MGTNFVNPISRGSQPRFHESSQLRSPRDTDSLHKGWKKNAQSTSQVYNLSQAVEQIQRELNRLRMRKGGGVGKRGAPVAGMVFKGEWINTTVYDSQEVVFRTPTGGSRGAYIGLLDNIAAGTPPETGAPWWAAWPYPPSGMWG